VVRQFRAGDEALFARELADVVQRFDAATAAIKQAQGQLTLR
jgi:hypothetical protein